MYSGSIENCNVSDTTITVPFSVAGGILGYAESDQYYSLISNNFTGNVDSGQYAGGIVGTMKGGTLDRNSVMNGSSVRGSAYAGGIAGVLNSGGNVSNSYVYEGTTVSSNIL